MRIPVILAVLGCGAAALVAQTPDHLVGLTRNIPVLLHHDHNNCMPLQRCVPPGMPAALPQPYAGGTAWDSRRSAAWITNGALLALVDDNCVVLCPPAPLPIPVANPVLTGLDLAEGMGLLWVTDNLNNVYQLRPTCPPVVVGMCTLPIPVAPNVAVTGVAVDEACGLVFYTQTDFNTGLSRILVAPLGAPCQIVQGLPLPPCASGVAFGRVTGSALDWCRRLLYVTDGVATMAIRYQCNVGAPGITILGASCCFPPVIQPDPMIGLAVRPGRATSHGQPCANGICPNCPMLHGLVNDPNLGNGAFALDLQGAPANALAWCILGIGPCTPPGLLVPPLCGPILTPAVLGTLGPLPTGGAVGCTGSAVFGLPLPVIPGLCGTTMSSQCVVFCPGAAVGGFGTSVSNCLTWVLQGS